MDEHTSIQPRVIEDEMKESYLAYSMSVIVGRALPDVRDGLKPVHRRILYAMQQLGMFHNKAYKKSARIVGEVLGKFHPHGDTAVYDSMVRMAQEFSLRYPLIDGQGNFGSVDGDSAAAMRYTEARLHKRAEELLKDIEKETVDFVPNFDGSLEEPAFLPSKIPNLLINGSSGIAVGMATNIPPHNLNEVCDALIQLIDNADIDVMELMEYVRGPDFPTGGIILGKNGIKQAYAKGHGKVITKARTEIEEVNGRKKIIVNEIPYMVNKATLLEQIADHVKEKRIEGISDLRDESDRDGMRMVIELKQHANEQVVLNQLFKHTRLKESMGITLLSIVNGEPKVLNLKAMLVEFLKHRKEIVKRRTAYDLRQAKAREHILQGLIKALDSIDAVIKSIKASKTVQDASTTLQTTYELSEEQAKAILEMRLQKLSSLEQQKLRDELNELLKKIAALEAILADEQKVLSIIKEECEEVKAAYGDERRSTFEEGEEEILDEDLIQEETMVVTLTHAGYVKRVPLNTYKAQKRGGTGIVATTTKEEDFVEELFIASTHDYLLCFTSHGRVYWKKVYELPQGSRQARGTPIVNLIGVDEGEVVTTVIPLREFEEGTYLTFATEKGTVKRTDLEAYSRPRKGGIIAIGLEEGDTLINVIKTDGNQQLLLATKQGNAVKCKESDISVVGRSARGVRGIRLRSEDKVVGMVLAKDEDTLLTITEKGYGKRTTIEEYRLINRGGKGVRNIKCTPKNGTVVAVRHIEGDEDLLLISRNGVAIRTNAGDVSVIGRNTQGVKVMRLREGDEVVAVAKCPKEDVEIPPTPEEVANEEAKEPMPEETPEEHEEQPEKGEETENEEKAEIKELSEEPSEHDENVEEDNAEEEPDVDEGKEETADDNPSEEESDEEKEEAADDTSDDEANDEETKKNPDEMKDIMDKIQKGQTFKKNPYKDYL